MPAKNGDLDGRIGEGRCNAAFLLMLSGMKPKHVEPEEKEPPCHHETRIIRTSATGYIYR